ncbi:ATP-dependent 6-phosphofructokinase [Novipirellula artificiosorum]|uniref:6-phosphofructokinase n=1 Tax=Novipirellula artificiosorum TaxID=2528016 RepID=A0A5C6DM49_9BACT|nr:ATP-dependent 6-phosphofructokinase [Novipirellula artificiosorum]TWU37214.1 6-phosphofructokinase isozyme 1 [Novipirellula artificiosorum]
MLSSSCDILSWFSKRDLAVRIGVFCSGGDAPGMNACVRSVVRSATAAGHEVVGINRGYQGLIDQNFFLNAKQQPIMGARDVSNIIQRGGTILRSARCQRFMTDEGVRTAAENLRQHKIDALVPIGGNGTFRGSAELVKHWDGQVVGCPGTIDNDLIGTDFTIGFSTAVETAVDAIDKLRDTAESHERLFLVEVMGRHSGYLALYTALAAGAEIACVPETPTEIPGIVAHLSQLQQTGKKSIIVVVAEGDEEGGALMLAEKLQRAECTFATRTVILGHVQRGGSPSPDDRMLATRLGDFAVKSIGAGATGVMAGEVNSQCVLTPFEKTFTEHKQLPQALIDLLECMSN